MLNWPQAAAPLMAGMGGKRTLVSRGVRTSDLSKKGPSSRLLSPQFCYDSARDRALISRLSGTLPRSTVAAVAVQDFLRLG
jgi:hypothetical protein